jgi:hypothetical protein
MSQYVSKRIFSRLTQHCGVAPKQVGRRFQRETQAISRTPPCLVAVGLLMISFAATAHDANVTAKGTAASQGDTSASPNIREELAGGKTIGLVLADFDYMFYRTKDGKAECPDGFVHSNRENWEAQFPTQGERKRHLDRCVDMANRGPNCENVWFSPETIKDPLPYREVTGTVAYGSNLDGNNNGRATKNTCAHEQFISPEGKPGIDNQYYRFFGCTASMRGDFVGEKFIRKFVPQDSAQRILLEIKAVGGERDRDAVEVAIYKGKDPLIVDAQGKATVGQSQRIDETVPPDLVYRLRGRILDGEVVTEPADVMWDNWYFEQRLLVRGMILHLKLTALGAEVVRLGYIDVQQLWESYSRYGDTAGGAILQTSAPAAYVAMHQLADGYRDPQSGQCTALSSMRKFEFVRANVIPPKEPTP